MVGAKCGTDKSPTGCLDPRAKCKSGLCQCKPGYVLNLNTVSCGKCQCKPGYVLNPNTESRGKCQCKPGYVLNL